MAPLCLNMCIFVYVPMPTFGCINENLAIFDLQKWHSHVVQPSTRVCVCACVRTGTCE